MYSLDVNFLNDRPDIVGQRDKPTPTPTPAGAMTPLYIGVAVGLLLPGLVGGFWFFLQQQNAQLEQQKAELNNRLGSLKASEQQIKQLIEETNRVKTETAALAGVFNQIKPWSAMLQDIRERTPPGVRIGRIQQTQVQVQQTQAAAPAPSPAPSPAANAPNQPPGNNQANNNQALTTRLEINGIARSFDDVNYFLLTLKRSPFLKGDETQLVRAELRDNPARLEVNRPQNQNQSSARVTYTLPKSVEYTIATSLSEVPASELIRELDRKGAVGLVTRIRTLQEKGVIQR
jgi:type IV pilus assembly protein PilN